MKDITVLITAAGNVFMPGTTACLKNNGERNIRLIGADMNDDATMLEMVDAYYPVPRGDDPTYVDVLLDICKKENVDVLLPIMSVELEILAQNRERFKEIGTIVSVSEIKALEIANDKLKLLNYMKEQGMTCAAFKSVATLEELKEAAYEMGYPTQKVCVKTTHGSGSRGFRILDAAQSKLDRFMHEKPNSSSVSLEEMVEILSSAEYLPDMIVMEYLPGTEYTVDLLADKGTVLYNCARRSTNMDNSIMLDGIIDCNPEVLAICKGVVEKLGLDGNIGFDVKTRADGTPIIMECNPRITAGIPMFKAAGINLPYLCVKMLLGEDLPKVELKDGMKMKRRWMEMYCEQHGF
ncbi:MAG: ATP-grasp domain-containing protein [Eubacterium sp.]|nr:ATP-grasp domain-containing protein [Eubacterium sp.]